MLFFVPPNSSGNLMNCHLRNASASSAGSPVDGYVITSEKLLEKC